MSTNAKDLLWIMSARLSMQESGVTKIPAASESAVRQLVDKLGDLPDEEVIEISYSENPFQAKYVRASTGEVLAAVLEGSNE